MSSRLEALFPTTGILGISKHSAHVFAQADRLSQRPGPVGVKGDARLGETLVKRGDSLNLLLPGQDPAFEFEIRKTVAFLGCLGKTHHGLRAYGLLIAHAEPALFFMGAIRVGQRGFFPVPDVEKIAQDGHRLPQLPRAKECGKRQIHVLAKEIKQCGFKGGERMDSYTLVKGLYTAPATVALREGLLHLAKQRPVVPDALPQHQRLGIFKGLTDFFTAGTFTKPGMPRAVAHNHYITREIRAVGTA